tara:strand:- start:310 stop:735 length:426 start_codon:yes stop_codon:yes gene_type:complete
VIADLNDLTADFIDTSIEAREWAWSELRVRYNSPQCIVLRYKGKITGVVFYTVDGDDVTDTMYASNPPWKIADNVAEIRNKITDLVFLHFFDTLGLQRVFGQTSPGNKRIQGMWKKYTGQTLNQGLTYDGFVTREQYANKK